MPYTIQIAVDDGTASHWENYQSLNATNDRAAARCFTAWLEDITPGARCNFRLIKVIAHNA